MGLNLMGFNGAKFSEGKPQKINKSVYKKKV